MNKIYEAWYVGKDLYSCYTEDPEAHRELTRFNPAYATYEKRGHVFAWQHRVRRSALVYLDSKFNGRGILKNNELQASQIEILPLAGRSRTNRTFGAAPRRNEVKSDLKESHADHWDEAKIDETPIRRSAKPGSSERH